MTTALTLTQITGLSPDNRSMLPSHDFVIPNCLIGIEVEVEYAYNLDKVPFKLWTVKEDPSLRNDGRELITPPVMGMDISRALSELEDVFSNHPELTFNERTSDHIHMDVRELDVGQLRALVILYCIFERSLFRYCGGNRSENIYCLPLYVAQGVLLSIARLFISSKRGDIARTASHLDTYYKYQAINLKPVLSQGSIEFRHMVGTSDKARLVEWINMLLCLKKAAITFTEDDIPHLVSGQGGEAFVRSVFGNLADKLINPFTQVDVFKGIRLAQDFIYTENLVQGSTDLAKVSIGKSALQKFYLSTLVEEENKPVFEWDYDNPFDEQLESFMNTNVGEI